MTSITTPKEKGVFWRLRISLKTIYRDAHVAFPHYFIYFVANGLATALAPLALMFLPPIVVGFIAADNADLTSFFLLVCSLSLVSMLLSYVKSYTDVVLDNANTVVRVGQGIINFFNKAFSCDFDRLSSVEDTTSEYFQAASALDSNWNGYERMLNEMVTISGALLSLIIYAVFSAFVSGWIFLLLLVMSIVFVVVSFAIDKVCQRKNHEAEKYNSQLSYFNRISSDDSYGKDIRNYDLNQFIQKKEDSAAEAAERITTTNRVLNSLPNVISALFVFWETILAYWFLIERYLDNDITLGALTFLLSAVTSFGVYLSTATTSFNSLSYASRECIPYCRFLKKKDRTGGKENLQSIATPWKIEIKDLWFRYKPSSPWVFKGLNLTINPGEKIALVGENGAGKTTLVSLLCGLYVPEKGTIEIDGKNLQDYPFSDYLKHLSVINQSGAILPFTVEFNVCGQEDGDKERLTKALKEAGIYDDIQKLPRKEKTYLTSNYETDGIELSGGQTQKVLLARALYRNGDLLLLDEPTAALDPLAEEEIYQKYNQLTAGKTSIFISHRLASTRFCDRIILLEHGEIIEQGMHEELLKANGEYRRMFEAQASYYRWKKGEENERR